MKLFNKTSEWRQILILAIAVLGFRILYVDLLNYLQNDYQFDVFDLIFQIFKNIPVVLFLFISGFLSVHYINKFISWGQNPSLRLILLILSFLIISLIVTLMLCVPKLKEYTWGDLFATRQLEAVFLVAAMLNILVMGVTDVILYYRKSHRKALDAEITKKNKVKYQYEQLKRQLNPHFLFNSLNVLDYLVHTDADRASDFIGKLAGVYRYLLSKESESVVTLDEERTFVSMYVDLLKERFTEGLEVEIELEDRYLKTFVIPCSIQLLVENATKHNAISKENPLKISIRVKDHFVRVENNLLPRTQQTESSNLGLKNIEGQYQALFRKSILVSRTDTHFSVCLPIIDKT
ncbi:MAG TPA: histidine kinase [Bacteroidales bacterium]|nr:histidine kinase [Bacteroidales bacterium]